MDDKIKIDNVMAEDVMGWKPYKNKNGRTYFNTGGENVRVTNYFIKPQSFSPTASIEDSFMVINQYSKYDIEKYDDFYHVFITKQEENIVGHGKSESLPEAICEAALDIVIMTQ